MKLKKIKCKNDFDCNCNSCNDAREFYIQHIDNLDGE